jgi:hypothetical protein
MDMRFGTWNIRGPYRTGSLKTIARELGKHRLAFEGVKEVRRKESGT